MPSKGHKKNNPATSRLTILMTPEEKHSLGLQALSEGKSMADIYQTPEYHLKPGQAVVTLSPVMQAIVAADDRPASEVLDELLLRGVITTPAASNLQD